MPSPAPPRRRPFGVHVVVGLLLASAALVVGVALRPDLGFPDVSLLGRTDRGLLRAANWAFVGLAVAAAPGLLFLRRWAWLLTMLLVGSGMLVQLVRWAHDAANFALMLLYVLVVFYLNLREVQGAFARRGARPPEP